MELLDLLEAMTLYMWYKTGFDWRNYIYHYIYMSQPNLGLEEQGALFWVIMASFLVWMVGGIYLGVAGDQWLSRGLKY